MHRLSLAALLSIACGACVPASAPVQPMLPPAPTGVPTTLSAAQISAVQDGLRTFLKDPESARFSGGILAATAPNGDITACGLVNAKNSYGGYTGDTLFITKLRGGSVVDAATAGATPVQTGIVTQMCRREGVPI